MSTRPDDMHGNLYWASVKVRAFLARDLLLETSYKLQSLFRLLSILFQVLTFYFLAKLVGGETTEEHLAPYGGDYFAFTLIGLSFSGFLNAGLIAFTTSIRQQMTMGVFEAMVAAPIRPVALLAYSLLWPLGFELLKAVFYLLVGVALFGAELSLTRLPLLLAALGLSSLVFGSLGVIAGSLILYFKKGDPIAWFLTSATNLIGGVYFPLTLLPDWLITLAHLMPVPYALNVFRGALIPGATLEGLNGDLLALGVFTVLLVPLALLSATVVLDKARRAGTLGQF